MIFPNVLMNCFNFISSIIVLSYISMLFTFQIILPVMNEFSEIESCVEVSYFLYVNFATLSNIVAKLCKRVGFCKFCSNLILFNIPFNYIISQRCWAYFFLTIDFQAINFDSYMSLLKLHTVVLSLSKRLWRYNCKGFHQVQTSWSFVSRAVCTNLVIQKGSMLGLITTVLDI